MRGLTSEEVRECCSSCETKTCSGPDKTSRRPSSQCLEQQAGHVSKLMATGLIGFLKKQTNCGRVVLNEKRVNRRGDVGLKVLCEYISEGDNLFREWLHPKDRRGIYNVEHCLDLHVFSTDSI